MGLTGKRAKCLLRIRHVLKFSHLFERTPCPLCAGQERHTISHVISRCQYGPTKVARAKAQRVITSRMDKRPHLTILGWPPSPHWSQLTVDPGSRPVIHLRRGKHSQACAVRGCAAVSRRGLLLQTCTGPCRLSSEAFKPTLIHRFDLTENFNLPVYQ